MYFRCNCSQEPSTWKIVLFSGYLVDKTTPKQPKCMHTHAHPHIRYIHNYTYSRTRARTYAHSLRIALALCKHLQYHTFISSHTRDSPLKTGLIHDCTHINITHKFLQGTRRRKTQKYMLETSSGSTTWSTGSL